VKRYTTTIETGGVDSIFGPQALHELASESLGKPVLLLFAEEVGRVVVASCDGERVTVTFDCGQELDGFQLVPSFRDGRLDCLGLVPG
jgi:hypothetical protein